jgi:hypothetical protein
VKVGTAEVEKGMNIYKGVYVKETRLGKVYYIMQYTELPI